MALDLAALRAKIAAQKAANTPVNTPVTTPEVKNEAVPATASNQSGNSIGDSNNNVRVEGNVSSSDSSIPTVNPPAVLGTGKTSEIDHLDFISKMNSLSEAIHKQHPTMPVLLMQIHKQLRADPELVTTLDEDAIGIVVKGLQIQTKTELVAEVVKKTTGGRKKNSGVSVDML